MKIYVLGAGTWGAALAALLANIGHDVTLWSALPKEIDDLAATRTHKNLPGTTMPESLKYTKDIADIGDGELILFVVPSEFIRSTSRAAAPYLRDGMILASAAKGIEKGTLLTMTEVMENEINSTRPRLNLKFVALSGPTHAEEVALGLPTSIVSASEDEETALTVAKAFSSSCMRVYTNTDVLGVEIAGAFKNIVALASGMNRGMGFGDNSQAMLPR